VIGDRGAEELEAVLATELPRWAREIKTRYEAGIANQFLLHGNVFDLIPFRGQYLGLRRFLYEALCGDDPDELARLRGRGMKPMPKLVLHYNVGEGLSFPTPAMEEDFRTFYDVARGIGIESERGADRRSVALHALREPRLVLPILQHLLATRNRVVVIVDDAEAIAPAGDIAFLNPDYVRNMIMLRRWATDPKLLRKDSWVMLITENLSEMHPKLTGSTSRMVSVPIPMPDESERRDCIRALMRDPDAKGAAIEVTEDRLAALTAGLGLVHIGDIFRKAAKAGTPIDFELVRRRKKEIIESECGDLVQVVEGERTLDNAGGLQAQKAILNRIVKYVREGPSRRVPKGLYCQGPPGSGKSFLMRCFAGSCGITSIVMKSFWNKYVGGTEANVERLLRMLEAMGPIILIIDEYDQTFGRRGSGFEGDSGVRQRVWAMFSEFMGREDLEGQVIFVALMNRSDLVDPASKRAGRFDRRIPFFLPSKEEQPPILRAVLKNNDITYEGDETFARVIENLGGCSAADLNEIAQLADALAADAGRDVVREDDLLDIVQDYVPSEEEDPEMIEYMELLAARTASSKKLLPDRYRKMVDEGTLTDRLRLLRTALSLKGML
jgi:transitional endoplasmic reticulum ATPase